MKETPDIKVIITNTRRSIVKKFHVRQRLSYYPERYYGPADAYPFNTDDMENESYLLAEILFKLEGIQRVKIDGYYVRIMIGYCFKWEEVEDEIIALIKKYIYTMKITEG